MNDRDRISPQVNIKNISDENEEKYHLGDYWLIQYQILRANIIGIVWQTVRRIADEILGTKGIVGQDLSSFVLGGWVEV